MILTEQKALFVSVKLTSKAVQPRKQPSRGSKSNKEDTTLEPPPVAAQAVPESIPLEEKLRRFEAVHNNLNGHHGIHRTVSAIQSLKLAWQGLAKDITAFIQECPVCQKDRLGQRDVQAVLGSVVSYALFEELAIDFIGPLPVDTLGNRYIFNAICSFSRYTELIAVEAATAVIAAHCLLSIVARYGCFRRIRSDKGTHFVNEVLTDFLRLFEIQSVLTLAERPQANGLCERNGAEVMRHLRALTLGSLTRDIWSVMLPLTQRILNKTFRQCIGCSPNDLVFVRAPDLDRGIFEPFKEASALAPMSTSTVQELHAAHELLLDITSLHVLKEQRAFAVKYAAATPTDFPMVRMSWSRMWRAPPVSFTRVGRAPFKSSVVLRTVLLFAILLLTINELWT